MLRNILFILTVLMSLSISIPNSYCGNTENEKTKKHQISLDTETGLGYRYWITKKISIGQNLNIDYFYKKYWMKTSTYTVSDSDVGEFAFAVIDLRIAQFLQGISINLQTGLSSKIKSNYKNKIEFTSPFNKTQIKIELEVLLKKEWWIIGKFIPLEFEYYPYLDIYDKKINIISSTRIGIGFQKKF